MARILVIDDEDLVRFCAREILEAVCHEVAEACDGEAGIALHDAAPFDLIITDILMPGKGGIQTINELKSKDPNLKIVAISGGGRNRNLDSLSLAKKYGADRALAKPYTEEDLLKVVRECFDEESKTEPRQAE